MLWLSGVTIYDIQYTTNAGSGTYPSPYQNQTVTLQGIVTATEFLTYHAYFLSMPESGAWRGIMIYDPNHSPNVGDNVQITGEVFEYYGLTEINNVSSYTVLSTNNPVPALLNVTTAEANSEPYEGCYVQVQNATVTQTMNSYNEWYVSDGSGAVQINDGFMDMNAIAGQVVMGNVFEYIRGFMYYSYSAYNLNPRSEADVQLGGGVLMVSVPDVTVTLGGSVQVPINVSNLSQSMNYTQYGFQLSYNPGVITYQNYSVTNTLSGSGTLAVTPSAGSLNVTYTHTTPFTGSGVLIRFNFTGSALGTSPLNLNGFNFNSNPIFNIDNGSVTVTQQTAEVVDTLTVIQLPLLNIPAIVVPGEQLRIECVAPTNTTGWAAQLKKGNIAVSLPITQAQYENLPARWVVKAQVPTVNIFELYDLQVTASGGINDRTAKSVCVLPSRKTSYYFAHVTDMHMPTHIFYPDAGYDTDSTETVDFREVIKDLNIIRPEFVLNTGDLVNQGELEDYENLRFYSKGKRLLKELEVPAYLVPGNHDIGGWTGTAPPPGTGPKNWWRFFGWSWLNNPNASYPYHTQDYSFDYGPVHYIGLTAYDNYDNYLYNIFGDNSFTNQQLSWLQSDLALNGQDTNVLFYHYDYDDELNLTNLGVDMALWGHIHYNSGSLIQTPYNLATDATCDGGRAYRIIRVNGTTLTPYATCYAGTNGTNINLNYFPHNLGTLDSVMVVVNNYQPLTFENALVKFNMPAGNWAYTVTNGVLEQVDRSGSVNVCYVRVNLTANSIVNVSLKQSGTPTDDQTAPATVFELLSVSPNPFSTDTTLSLKLERPIPIVAAIYNLKGEKVKQLYDGKLDSGYHKLAWDGRDERNAPVPAGIYLLKLQAGTVIRLRKVLKY